MELNIPKSSSVNHELPVVQEISEDTKIPVSEVKSRLHQGLLDLHQKAMDDPKSVSYGDDSSVMVDQAVANLKQETEHPEETNDEDAEYDDMFNVPLDDEDMQAPGADSFAATDNMDFGFSDGAMADINNTADAAFDGFGAEDDISAGDINNMSVLEPGASPEGDGADSENTPSEDSGLDLDNEESQTEEV